MSKILKYPLHRSFLVHFCRYQVNFTLLQSFLVLYFVHFRQISAVFCQNDSIFDREVIAIKSDFVHFLILFCTFFHRSKWWEARKNIWSVWQRPNHGCWTNWEVFTPCVRPLDLTVSVNLCPFLFSWETGRTFLAIFQS